ncbi:MAG: diacylglycerol kinase [Patescibacteria group bacterium]
MKRYFMSLGKSFRAAVRGFVHTFAHERTFQVMVAMALGVLIVASLLPLGAGEKGILLLVTGLVLVLELVNTMVERLVDLLKPRLSSYVQDVKDVMAAAVFVGSLFACIIGVTILFPYLSVILSQL